MLTDSELAGMRATSAAALPDVGAFTRPAGGGTLNTSTGAWVPNQPVTVYDGPLRVRRPTSEEHDVLFGERQVTTARYVVTLPHDADGINVDDQLVLSVSSDADLIGRPMRVLSVSIGSWEIDRRVAVEVVDGV